MRIRLLTLVASCALLSLGSATYTSSTQKEAACVLNRQKALFTLIPPRVAQVLKILRLQSHAAPADRLELVHATLRHVRDKYHVVGQLQDRVKEARKALTEYVPSATVGKFKAFERQIKKYMGTLVTTLKVLDDEAGKLVIMAQSNPSRMRYGKAYNAAQAVLAPNKIDTLVDTLAGQNDSEPQNSNSAMGRLSNEIKALRQQIAVMAAPSVVPAVPVAQDFSQVLADISVQHAAVPLEKTSVLSSKDIQMTEKKEKKKDKQKKSKKPKKSKKKSKKKDKSKKKSKKKKDTDKQKRQSVLGDIKAEVSSDLSAIGYGALKGYRAVKNGFTSALGAVAHIPYHAYRGVQGARQKLQAFAKTRPGVKATPQTRKQAEAIVQAIRGRLNTVRNAVARGVYTPQPALMATAAVGGQLASQSMWSMAGRLHTESALDPMRVVHQPLLPSTLEKTYNDAVKVSQQSLARVGTTVADGVRSFIDYFKSVLRKGGMIAQKSAHVVGNGLATATRAVGSAGMTAATGVAATGFAGLHLGKKVAHTATNAARALGHGAYVAGQATSLRLKKLGHGAASGVATIGQQVVGGAQQLGGAVYNGAVGTTRAMRNIAGHGVQTMCNSAQCAGFALARGAQMAKTGARKTAKYAVRSTYHGAKKLGAGVAFTAGAAATGGYYAGKTAVTGFQKIVHTIRTGVVTTINWVTLQVRTIFTALGRVMRQATVAMSSAGNTVAQGTVKAARKVSYGAYAISARTVHGAAAVGNAGVGATKQVASGAHAIGGMVVGRVGRELDALSGMSRNFFVTIANAFDTVGALVFGAISSAWDGIGVAINAVQRGLAAGYNQLMSWGHRAVLGVQSVFGNGAQLAQRSGATAVGLTRNAAARLQRTGYVATQATFTLGNAITYYLQAAKDLAIGTARAVGVQVFNGAASTRSAVGAGIQKTGQAAATRIQQGAHALKNISLPDVSTPVAKVKKVVNNGAVKCWQTAKGYAVKTAVAAGSGAVKVKHGFTNTLQAIVEVVPRMGARMIAIGRSIGDSLHRGYQRAVGTLRSGWHYVIRYQR